MKEYRYYYPPRPKKKIPNEMVSFYERRGWAGQYKKNGTCTVLYVDPNKNITVKTRHNSDHKMWTPTEKSTGIFKKTPGKGWYVFTCELLHNKTKEIKDTVYIFDIIVNDGEELVGTTFEQRQEILRDLFLNTNTESTYSHYILSSNIWLAKVFYSNFDEIMDDVNYRASLVDGNFEDEGLVFKDPKARLEAMEKEDNNSKWQVKTRAKTENYSF